MKKYTLDLPTPPDGYDFARDSFWWTYRERFTIPRKFGWKVKRQAFEWFDRLENRARLDDTEFPPKPIFRPIPNVPQPKDGKDGATGWTPRNN